jgi:hypothetical protein
MITVETRIGISLLFFRKFSFLRVGTKISTFIVLLCFYSGIQCSCCDYYGLKVLSFTGTVQVQAASSIVVKRARVQIWQQ